MATTQYFEDELYPVNKDGKADKTKTSTTFEIYITNYYGDHQIYLKTINENGEEKQFHLTKEQARNLSDSLDRAESYIGYDNT